MTTQKAEQLSTRFNDSVAFRLHDYQKQWLKRETAKQNLELLQSGEEDTITIADVLRGWLHNLGMPQ